jgi:hypothetical protein
LNSFVGLAGGQAACAEPARLRVDHRFLVPTHPEPQESPVAEEPTVPAPLDKIDFESLSDDELRGLTRLLMREGERRMGLEPGPEGPL